MKRYIILILSLLSFSPLVAQQTDTTSSESLIHSIGNELVIGTFRDVGRIATSPLKWKGRQWVYAGSAVAATALAHIADAAVQDFAVHAQSNTGDVLATYIGQPLGNGYYLFTATLGTYLGGKVFHNPKVSDPALVAFKAVLIADGAAGIIKFLIHRQRPSEGEGPDPNVFYGPSFRTDMISFPSGHTAGAFALASALSTYYHDKLWVSLVSYPLAAVTACSRIYDNRHWLSDVVFGAAVGYFIGHTVAKPQLYRWSMLPNSEGGMSLGVTYSF